MCLLLYHCIFVHYVQCFNLMVVQGDIQTRTPLFEKLEHYTSDQERSFWEKRNQYQMNITSYHGQNWISHCWEEEVRMSVFKGNSFPIFATSSFCVSAILTFQKLGASTGTRETAVSCWFRSESQVGPRIREPDPVSGRMRPQMCPCRGPVLSQQSWPHAPHR